MKELRNCFFSGLFAGIIHLTPILAYSSQQVDSLKKVLTNTTDNCERAILNNQISEAMKLFGADSSLVYATAALDAAKKCGNATIIGTAYLSIASAYDLAGNYIGALKNAQEARKLFEANNSKENLALCFHKLGNISYHQSESADGENKNGFYLDALNYYNDALAIEESLGNQLGQINNYIEIGKIKFDLGDPDGAISILMDALQLSEQFPKDKNYIHNVAKSSYNISLIYISQDSFNIAINYLAKAVAADSSLENKEGLAGIRMAEMYLFSGDNDRAAQVAYQHYDTALVYGYKLRQKQASDVLYRALAIKGNYEDAYHYLLINKTLGDELRNEEHIKEITSLELNYEFEKIEKQKEEERLKEAARTNLIIYLGLAALLIVIIIALIFYRNYRQKQKNNLKLQLAHDIIEEKNADIMSSIRYAKRIQEAILPPNELVKSLLSNSFILYKPKEVVSGDFYWIDKTIDGCAFAVVDCTGHGVPGAFMSIIGNNALHRTVHEFNVNSAGAILDKMNELVGETLRQKSNTEIRDGMDISLCVLKTENGKKVLEFAGANNPIYIHTDGAITELKANKQPIGAFENTKPFSTQRIELKGNETIYMFSDGYADQFGGDKGKKFMYKPFKELLLSFGNKSLDEQKEILDKKIEEWRGSFEQIDDICIMGIRV